MIEQTLETIISTIGVVYVLLFILSGWKAVWFIVMSIVAFVMVIGVLLMGKFVFGVW